MVGRLGCGCVAIVEKDVVWWVRFVAGKKYYLLFWKGGAVHLWVLDVSWIFCDLDTERQKFDVLYHPFPCPID